MLINNRCKKCSKNKSCTKRYKTEIVEDLSELPEDVQLSITDDIEKRLLPQAQKVYKILGIEGAEQYVNDEIQCAGRTILKMLNEASREGVYIDVVSKTIVYNIERRKMLQKFLEDCKKSENTVHDTIKLPCELDVGEAKKYFVKAIEKGYMEKTNSGYRWRFGGDKGQARLGYFCNMVYKPPRPINKLEEIFEVKKLSASITTVDEPAKRSDVIEWRNKMDNDIFND